MCTFLQIKQRKYTVIKDLLMWNARYLLLFVGKPYSLIKLKKLPK